jgi:hypothetical protein
LPVHSLLALQDDGELYKLQQLLLAPLNRQNTETRATAEGWVSVEIQHLLPVLTALGAGVLLSVACLLLEMYAGRRDAGKRRTCIKQRTAVTE